MKLKITLVSIVSVLLFSGCDSPKDASKENFEKVLNKFFDENCVMVSPYKNNFPVTVELIPNGDYNSKELNKSLTEKYEALVSAGMLEVKDGSIQKTATFTERIYTVLTKIYSLSKKGEESFKSTKIKTFSSDVKKGFCVANYKIDEITNFSEPSQMMGYTISKVNYVASPKNINELGKNENILKSFPLLKEELNNKSKTTTLVLMNDGWVHSEEAMK